MCFIRAVTVMMLSDPPVFLTAALKRKYKKPAFTWSCVGQLLLHLHIPVKHKIWASTITLNVVHAPIWILAFCLCNTLFCLLYSMELILLFTLAPGDTSVEQCAWHH